MKITVITKTFEEGVSYWRLFLPHKDMAGVEFIQDCPDDIETDLIIFSKNWCSIEALELCKNKGIKTIVDFDDWIRVGKDHLLQDYNDSTENFIKYCELSDLIICTTEYLRDKLLQFTDKIEVIPNALNESELPEIKRIFNYRQLIFGYTGGRCHLPDVKELSELTRSLQKDFTTKNQFFINLFGYYDNELKNQYFKILAGGYPEKVIKSPYIKTSEYLNIYNACDVSLIPLVDNEFNNCKSELKLIEAGFFKKACIVQNVIPYTNIIENDINCLTVENKFQWYKNAKKLINNRNMVIDLGLALYDRVRIGYDLTKWNIIREQIYKSLIN